MRIACLPDRAGNRTIKRPEWGFVIHRGTKCFLYLLDSFALGCNNIP